MLENGPALLQLKAFQREFDSIQNEGALLPHVPATRYLHSKLELCPRPIPTFGFSGFRVLEGEGIQDDDNEYTRLVMQDGELQRTYEEMRRLCRVIAELELTSEMIQRDARHSALLLDK